MSDLKLGEILDTPQERDAIHVAVAPVIADELLKPGDHIGFIEGSTERVGRVNTTIGIVDPYLQTRVRVGERCWMFLYPNTITSLRHDWTHPAFQKAQPVISQAAHLEKSKLWLTDHAKSMGGGMTYDDLMDAAHRWVKFEDHTVEQGAENWRDSPPKDLAEFWHHYEIVAGEKPDDAERWFFCCTC